MTIFVDADACPVKEIIVRAAKRAQIAVVMVFDTSHAYTDGYSTTIVVDKARDSADFKIANRIQTGDLVVTQDYGVAAMAIGKKARAIHPNGLVYTVENIDALLAERHLAAKIRAGGGRANRMKKRTCEDDRRFEAALLALLADQTG